MVSWASTGANLRNADFIESLAIALSAEKALTGRLGFCRGHVEWRSLRWDTMVTPVEFVEKLIGDGWDAYLDPSYWEHVRIQKAMKGSRRDRSLYEELEDAMTPG